MKGGYSSDIIGIIEGVYEDLGPCTTVRINHIHEGCQIREFDIRDFPWPVDVVKGLVGKKVHIVSSFLVDVIE
jgi:hypothetical protein